MSLIQPTRILVVSSGGREHALAWKLAAEPGVNEVLVAPGSDGIGTEPRVRALPDTDPLDGPGLVAVARAHASELVVIGPEAPLAAGVAAAPELLAYLADRPLASVRELIGIVHRLLAAAETTDVPLTLAAARQELEPARRAGGQDEAARAGTRSWFGRQGRRVGARFCHIPPACDDGRNLGLPGDL